MQGACLENSAIVVGHSWVRMTSQMLTARCGTGNLSIPLASRGALAKH